jgi:two-component system C4-dicarboxylate transport response regulator DctD
MPRVTGLDVLKQVRTVDADIPFLMVTGVADMDSVMQCKALGITGYVKKPFSKDDLRRKMQTVANIITHRKKKLAS